MQIIDLALDAVKLITLQKYEDERGFFMETFRQSFLQGANINDPFVQDNHSFSKKNVLRGMHFQLGGKQSKLVRAVYGEIYDVAVDVRKNSKTFGKWVGIRLDDRKHQMLYVPKGFAHGFCVLSTEAHVVYKVSTYYEEELERSFRYNDPAINIRWPIENPILSLKDRQAPCLNEFLSSEGIVV